MTFSDNFCGHVKVRS